VIEAIQINSTHENYALTFGSSFRYRVGIREDETVAARISEAKKCR